MKNLSEIIDEAFAEVYRNTTPPEDYYLLKKDSTLSSDWFENYFISEDLFEIIVNRYVAKYKLSGSDKSVFINTLYLGPSPKFKKKR